MIEETFGVCERCKTHDMCVYQYGLTLCPECYGLLVTLLKGFLGQKVQPVKVNLEYLIGELGHN